jgi:hypothetical protein
MSHGLCVRLREGVISHRRWLECTVAEGAKSELVN